MTNNLWRSVDAHFHDGAWKVLQSVLPIKAATNSFMTEYTLSEVWFPRTHDQTLLTLRWRSFSRWGREGIAICFAYKGSQKFLYDWLQPIGGVISQDTWPKIVDAPLMLIFMMGQGVKGSPLTVWWWYMIDREGACHGVTLGLVTWHAKRPPSNTMSCLSVKWSLAGLHLSHVSIKQWWFNHTGGFKYDDAVTLPYLEVKNLHRCAWLLATYQTLASGTIFS